MATARSLFVSDHASGNYHCVSRCVRRAWLCGIDPYSNNDYTHRKAWVEQRLHEVAACFAIGIYGYAVMSNHLHLVVHVDVDAAQRSDYQTPIKPISPDTIFRFSLHY